MAEIISGIYRITNTITGDFYIGSSKDVKQRWASHKCQSTWNKHPNNSMYLDMRKYGVDNFEFQVIEVVESDSLKETEQQFIELLKPTYNSNNAKGLDIERLKKYKKEYRKSDKCKEQKKSYKRKESKKKHDNQLCSYNGETITRATLAKRFYRAGIKHPIVEANKYLVLQLYQ